ncbi:hypothetical protein JRQ81_008841 [Phrynocephalus forsythii]|uniref:Uncharacterized protein n=1 Tax=Phrynocephalus forsythii TaxID=171643 RepID=A0A9Q0XCP9_9SAUR|nr:hypothetical protein JRQ81_008841 [Phrynocephalus forsythii]
MPRPKYVLCQFKKRWWPGKVLSRSRASRRQLTSVNKAASVRVEIMCLKEQVNVQWADVTPLTEERIEEIASTLDQSQKCCSPTKELTYRRALRVALDILQCAAKSMPGTSSKRSKDEPPKRKDQPFGTSRRPCSPRRDPPKRGEQSEGLSRLQGLCGPDGRPFGRWAVARHARDEITARTRFEGAAAAAAATFLQGGGEAGSRERQLMSEAAAPLASLAASGSNQHPGAGLAQILFPTGVGRFSVSLKNLKPFDCQEKQKLIEEAREDYNDEINWCINLIEDYRIRVGCCSFRGSFLEYCADAMSYPVRREAPRALSQMNFPQAEEEGDSWQSLSETPPAKLPKKVLPDRTRASRDRANGKIVDFIVKARGADRHLCSVLKSERPSRWLARFLRARPYLTSIETYLEDDSQQDLVFRYLQEVYRELDTSALPLVNGDRVRFILDVLFPEAIIYAISAIERIDYKKAEEKYLQGPLVSQREREIFEEEILEQKRKQQMENATHEDSV